MTKGRTIALATRRGRSAEPSALRPRSVSWPTLATARNAEHAMCRFGHIAAQAFRSLACVGREPCASARVRPWLKLHTWRTVANGKGANESLCDTGGRWATCCPRPEVSRRTRQRPASLRKGPCSTLGVVQRCVRGPGKHAARGTFSVEKAETGRDAARARISHPNMLRTTLLVAQTRACTPCGHSSAFQAARWDSSSRKAALDRENPQNTRAAGGPVSSCTRREET